MAAAAPIVPPGPYRGLIQYCDTVASKATVDAAGRLVSLSDLSGQGNPLQTSGGSGPQLVSDSSIGAYASFLADSQPMSSTFAQQLDAWTCVLLYKQPDYPNYNYGSPLFMSPTPDREPRPFVYVEGWNTLSFGGIGYTNYGYAIAKWQALVIAKDNVTGYNNSYHTDNGFRDPGNSGFNPVTGALIGYDYAGNYQVKTLAFANYAWTTAEIQTFLNTLQSRHKLTL